MASSDIDKGAAALVFACAWAECAAEFSSMHSLASHLSTAHLASPNDSRGCCLWRGCPYTSTPFTAHHDLVVHLKMHTGNRPYLCPLEGCGKVYKRTDFLEKHIQSHVQQNNNPAAVYLDEEEEEADGDGEMDEGGLEARLAYMHSLVTTRAAELERVNNRARRLRLENDILIDALGKGM